MAYVVRADGSQLDEDQVIKFVASQVRFIYLHDMTKHVYWTKIEIDLIYRGGLVKMCNLL